MLTTRIATMVLAASFGAATAGAQKTTEAMVALAEAETLAASHGSMATLASLAELVTDPDDSLYRAGREALNRGAYREAVRAFTRLRSDYPRSRFVADALYWEAFARVRIGGKDQLREARTLLSKQAEDHRNASTYSDGRALAVRVDGDLAQMGDEEAARRMAQRNAIPQSQDCDPDDIEVKNAALSALMNTNAERARPTLQRVLQRRDQCSRELRKTALFIVAQNGGADNSAILMEVVQNDPDPEIRGEAVFWLSQIDSPETVVLLDSILRHSEDPEMRDKALFALSQQQEAVAAPRLRDLAQDQTVPVEVRRNAVFWLGQQNTRENVEFLRGLFRSTTDSEMREQVLFAVAQTKDPANGSWLVGIATDRSLSMEIRKNALFWAGQSGAVTGDELVEMYDSDLDNEMKEQLIFVYSQSDSRAALDKLFEIARTESDKDLRQNAIFWIGQSDDPRAIELLEELISQ